MKVKRERKNFYSALRLNFLFFLFFILSQVLLGQGRTDNSPDWFYPDWAARAKFNYPIRVLDTDSALGRYSLQTKEVGLKDLARFHGHLCDGLVIAFMELRAVLEKLFPDGVVDRTDLRVVSKNGPCIIDAVMYLTGARVNFQTLRIDNSLTEGFIIQRISTGQAYQVYLRPGVFPAEQTALEEAIREKRRKGLIVGAEEIDQVEEMANSLIKKILSAPPEEILETQSVAGYIFRPFDFIGERGDVINKTMPRK